MALTDASYVPSKSLRVSPVFFAMKSLSSGANSGQKNMLGNYLWNVCMNAYDREILTPEIQGQRGLFRH